MAWQIDLPHSMIGFSAKHLGICTVIGRFEDADVAVELDGDDPSRWSLKATIRTASFTTGFDRRDDGVKQHYLVVDQFPSITFATQRVERRGDGFAIIGPLTMHGVTRDVELAATYNGDAVDRGVLRRGVSARGKINRLDFNLGEPGGTVGDDIEFILELEAAQQ